MSDLVTVQGVVISAMPMGDYDKRVVLLTRERGKISAFVKNARRQNSPLMAATNPFVFGTFTLFEGKSSYNLNQAAVSHYFMDLAGKQPAIYYGYYFLELADYFGQEGTDEKDTMNLLYVTIKALLNDHIDNRLIRCIFELRLMTIQGIMPQLFQCSSCDTIPSEDSELSFSAEAHGILDKKCKNNFRDARRISPSALYTMQYIVSSQMGKLYTFNVKDIVLRELERLIYDYTEKNTEKRFKSLEILQLMI